LVSRVSKALKKVESGESRIESHGQASPVANALRLIQDVLTE